MYSSIWRSIMFFIVLLSFIGSVGLVFFAGH